MERYDGEEQKLPSYTDQACDLPENNEINDDKNKKTNVLHPNEK